MEQRTRILRGVCQVLTAALLAGCGAFICVRALGFELPWLTVYLAAGLSALLVRLGRKGLPWGIGAALLVLGASGLILFRSLNGISAAFAAISEGGILSGDLISAHAAAGQSLGMLAAILLGAMFALLIGASSGIPFALMILLASVICALALNESLSLWTAFPGLMAGVAAFAIPDEGRCGGVRAAALIPAAVLALIAMLLVPAQRTTWEPMENLANAVRSVVEDYIHFTEQRVAFSINEKGYDRAGMISDSVVAMLGGPADPDTKSVMRVKTDGDLLLRGTIKRTYTGYSWVDDQAKARYLYYDFTHRKNRSEVFSINDSADLSAFESLQAEITMLSDGTSTLFVPAHMDEFSMSLADAVYYNSIGEIFLTREVAEGDSYALTALHPVDDNALMRAAAAGQIASDPLYSRMLEDYTQLPSGIDESVYALAVELTKNDSNPAAKALAIQNHLVQNYTYTLEGGYPETGRDFVSWFLNESREGYCSYFASAMTVLSRIAGLPARYVEGYYVPDGQEVLTGENAHAWTEIYFSGIGWTAFDPTARAMQAQGDLAQQGGEEEQNTHGEDHQGIPPENNTPTPPPQADDGTADPTPTPDPDIANTQNDLPTPSPQPQDETFSDPEGSQGEPDSRDNSDLKNDKRSRAWLWIVLGILLLLVLIAAAVLVIRRRLRLTDPIFMCTQTRSAQTAALILYRGILTLLAQAGQLPASGETPMQFAARVVKAMPNESYEAFVADVAASRYSGKNVSRQTLETGRSAYFAFLKSMGRGERLRYHARRVFHGIGSLEIIP